MPFLLFLSTILWDLGAFLIPGRHSYSALGPFLMPPAQFFFLGTIPCALGASIVPQHHSCCSSVSFMFFLCSILCAHGAFPVPQHHSCRALRPCQHVSFPLAPFLLCFVTIHRESLVSLALSFLQSLALLKPLEIYHPFLGWLMCGGGANFWLGSWWNYCCFFLLASGWRSGYCLVFVGCWLAL